MGNGPPLTIDLFCGAGGITEGFRQEGFECLFANDVDQDAIKTFQLNHPSVDVDDGPIEAIDPFRIRGKLGLAKTELDCLTGGPPCQGFSINAPGRFLDDPRNALFQQFVAFVREFEPKTIFFENVPGMVSFADGLVLGQVVRQFASLGYFVEAKILFSAHYGVPQERWRLVILGGREGYSPTFPSPKYYAIARANFTGGKNLTYKLYDAHRESLAPMVTVQQAIGDLPPLGSGQGEEHTGYTSDPHSEYANRMRKGTMVLRHHVSARIAEINLQRLKYIPPGGSWRDIPFDLLPAGMKKARRSDHTKRYGRLTPDGLAGTVMTKMDPHWGPAFHYEQERTLTVREAARLQSFPDSYTFQGSRGAQYRQVGNAVPVLMAGAIGHALRNCLEGTI
ncbi:MAG: hypothetical protein BZY88_08510 [SAR202 cluster bacterium Io17-Chloro-G9]|nr:MAG: hypothetical protein BZY88_08510 [SAR202 cluster bacterium Io17-Chloro-G9]